MTVPSTDRQPASTFTTRALRRRWLFVGVAGAAALAGAGLSWWQARPVSNADSAYPSFWDMSFPTPSGQPMAMRLLAGKPLLLNFWATWCPPCVEEMPLLDRFYSENHPNGWQVLGMAVDNAEAVQRFLARTPVRFPVTLAGLPGIELSRSFGNQAGGLPYSVVFDRAGQVAHRKMGIVSPQDLHRWRDGL